MTQAPPKAGTVSAWTRWETFCANCGGLYGEAHDHEEDARSYAQRNPYCGSCEEEEQ